VNNPGQLEHATSLSLWKAAPHADAIKLKNRCMGGHGRADGEYVR